MSKLEHDLMEYTLTREAVCEAAIAEAGRAGAHEAVAELRVIAAVRAIMDGQPVSGGEGHRDGAWLNWEAPMSRRPRP